MHYEKRYIRPPAAAIAQTLEVCPAWYTEVQWVPLGMRHQAEEAAQAQRMMPRAQRQSPHTG